MDFDHVRAVSGIQAAVRLPGILGGFLRRRTRGDEGRIAGHRARAAAALFPQLVSPAVPVCVCDVSLRAGDGERMTASMPATDTAGDREAGFVAELAADVRRHLAQRPLKIPSRYLYDALGSSLFDAICELPWYRVTRAEMRLLVRFAPRIWAALSPLDRIIELGAGDGRKLAALLSGRPRSEERRVGK